MKILLVSHNALSKTNANGNVLCQLFRDFKSEEICQLYFKNELPTEFIDSSFFRITDKDRLKGIFRKNAGGEVLMSNGSLTTTRGKQHNSLLSNSNLAKLIREFVWNTGAFDFSTIKKWVISQNPDLIVFQNGGYCFSCNIVSRLSRELNIPVVLYTTEDEYFHKRTLNLFHNFHLKLLKRAYKDLLCTCRHIIALHDGLKEEFENEFHIPTTTIMMSCQQPTLECTEDSTSFLYAGNVDRGRINTILSIANCLKSINEDYCLTVIPSIISKRNLRRLKKNKNIILKRFLPFNEYKTELNKASILFLVDSFKKCFKNITRATFSSKIADYIRSGKTLVVCAPPYNFTHKYFAEHSSSAVLIGDKNDMEEKLRKLFSDSDYKKTLSKNSLLLGALNHDIDKNAALFKRIIKSLSYPYRLETLVPTFNKNENELSSLISKTNVQGPCLISNQNGNVDCHTINDTRIIFSDSIGVSKNRNILISESTGDVLFFIDDDCSCVKNYRNMIKEEFSKHPDADCIIFSRKSSDNRNGSIKFLNKKVRSFFSVSKAGAPGIAIRKSALLINNIHFCERIGTPNFVYKGEDSLFIKNIIKSNLRTFTSSIEIITVHEFGSSYFEGFNEQFFVATGASLALIYPKIHFVIYLKQAFRYRKMSNYSFIKILKLMSKGRKIFQ